MKFKTYEAYMKWHYPLLKDDSDKYKFGREIWYAAQDSVSKERV